MKGYGISIVGGCSRAAVHEWAWAELVPPQWWSKDGIEAASLCSPVVERAEWAIELMRQGSDVLVELPVARTPEAAIELLSRAETLPGRLLPATWLVWARSAARSRSRSP